MNHERIWILADDRAGNVSQVIGLAEILALPYTQKNIHYHRSASLPNILRGASLLGVNQHLSDPIQAPWPDLVIGAGRKTAPIARYIKKQSKNHTKLIQLMDPGYPKQDFDLIVIPEHDKPAPHPNMITSVGALHKVTPSQLEKLKPTWQKHFAHLSTPYIGVLIGGDTKKGTFTPLMAKTLAHDLSEIAHSFQASLLITTSRRTSQEAAAALKTNLTAPHYFYDVSTQTENPYFGILALSDFLIISGDSISMCSEGCSTGKPVYIYAPTALIPSKHLMFHQILYKHHCAKPFTAPLIPFTPQLLNDTQDVAKEIRRRKLIT